ncbi:MAG: AraC family transcriptional regulator, partial [Paenibacillaceae bacterium]|nr:AraC family transcriptional regulator [Paenibacillaceae bacterium]
LQKIRQTEDQDWIREERIMLDGKPYVSTVLHSEAKGWYYVASVPEKAFAEKSDTQRNIMLGISISLVAAALLISYSASRTLYRPLKQLTSRVRLPAGAAGASKDEVELLGQYLESLDLKNEQLSKDVGRYSDHARHFMLHQLLVGNPPIHNLPLTDGDLLGDNSPYIPLLILDLNSIRMIESYSKHDCSLYYYAVDNIAKEILAADGEAQIIMLQPGMFVMALSMDNPPSPDYLRGLGRKLLDAIQRYLKLNGYVTVSCSDTGVGGLHDAFVEATELLRYRFILGDNQVVLTHDLEASVSIQAEALFQYESDIVVAIRERKWGEAESLFVALTEALQESFRVSEDLLRGYFPQLLNGIVKSVRSLPQDPFDASRLQGLLPLLAECRTLDEVKDFFRSHVFDVLHQEYENNGGVSQRVQLVRRVLDYIEANYDTDLSLQHCAELVQLHSFDLSRLFKQITGINFIDYLIAFRMEKAKEMLGDPQLKIQDIADKLRYSSQQGFIRAFKKSAGMTPGQYRSNLKE